MIYKCAACGKEFSFSGEKYSYKKKINAHKTTRTVYFCGYSCMRKFEKEREKESWQKQNLH